jgi:hypothetical protein
MGDGHIAKGNVLSCFVCHGEMKMFQVFIFVDGIVASQSDLYLLKTHSTPKGLQFMRV